MNVSPDTQWAVDKAGLEKTVNTRILTNSQNLQVSSERHPYFGKRTYVESESISKEVGREILNLTDMHGSYRSEISSLGLIKRGEIYIKTNNFMRYVNQNKQQNFNKGGSFLRICGAVSVGEYNKVIWYYKLSW